MPRKARKFIIAPQAMYHIVCRGINQRSIFWSQQDYKKFLAILNKAKKEFNFFVYSYNLLPNHFHLFIEAKAVPISRIMQSINGAYAAYFNRRYKRKGHLFQDRFYSSLVSKESYFWTLASYIDLNALRAGLVERPEDYPWSSYQFYWQKDYAGHLIDRERFLYFAGDKPLEELRRNYLDFIKEEAKKEKRPKFIKSEKFF